MSLVSRINAIFRRKPSRRAAPHVLMAAGLLSLASLVSAEQAQAAAPAGLFAGESYGTFTNLKVGPIAATLGFTAYIPCSCLGTNGETLSNSLAGLSAGVLGNVLSSGAVQSTVMTSETDVDQHAHNTSRIENIKALNGLILADSIVAVANTTATAQGIVSNDEGTGFVNLKIAGKAIDPNVPPNTQIPLPGIGTVTLRQEANVTNSRSSSITVQMITINVTQANTLALPIGSNIVIGHTHSGFSLGAVNTVVTGRAFAATGVAVASNLLKAEIGFTAFVNVGCRGTNGAVRINNIGAFQIGTTVGIGAGVSTATGGPTATGGSAQTSSTVTNASLLGGMIGVKSIKVVATTTLSNGVRTRSTAGTSFTGLTVLGLPISPAVKPNTKITLPLLGYVIVNEQIMPSATSTAETQVNGLHIFITTNNLLHLPVGAELLIGHAAAGAQSATGSV